MPFLFWVSGRNGKTTSQKLMTLGYKHSFLPDIWFINILVFFLLFSSCLRSHKEIWTTSHSFLKFTTLSSHDDIFNEPELGNENWQTVEHCSCYWRYVKLGTSHLGWWARQFCPVREVKIQFPCHYGIIK